MNRSRNDPHLDRNDFAFDSASYLVGRGESWRRKRCLIHVPRRSLIKLIFDYDLTFPLILYFTVEPKRCANYSAQTANAYVHRHRENIRSRLAHRLRHGRAGCKYCIKQLHGTRREGSVTDERVSVPIRYRPEAYWEFGGTLGPHRPRRRMRLASWVLHRAELWYSTNSGRQWDKETPQDVAFDTRSRPSQVNCQPFADRRGRSFTYITRLSHSLSLPIPLSRSDPGTGGLPVWTADGPANWVSESRRLSSWKNKNKIRVGFSSSFSHSIPFEKFVRRWFINTLIISSEKVLNVKIELEKFKSFM